ncbi:MAG: hypothetical protein VB099_18325 [Candidatus Limiplasma sp.]|nr:hypothetical protein [Candidatus Limiplasma sp.]
MTNRTSLFDSLQEVVGHSDIRTTMGYKHSQEETAIAAKKILDQIFDAAIVTPVTDL